ncbi:MAG: NUDIX hydrolase [Phycisphaerae bacterium]|nr:NUDIX hydrolase [Phycisphaerae bacterium]
MQSLLKCRKFEVLRQPVRTTDGRQRAYEIVAHLGSVVILPLLDDGRCVMIRNFRPAVDRELWELPAGTLDKPGELPEPAARRELEEETGYRAEKLIPLCEFYSSPGFLTELLRAYVATGLTMTEQHLEPTERIRVEPIDFADALAMVRDGRIVDAKTIVTLLRWDMEQRASA